MTDAFFSAFSATVSLEKCSHDFVQAVAAHRRKLLLGPGAQAPHMYDQGARLYDEPPTFVT